MLSTKIRTAVVTLAFAATVTTAGLSAPPADAAVNVGPVTGGLWLRTNGPSYHDVHIDGTIHMTQREADWLIWNGYKIQWRLWGDDPVSDDLLYGPATTTLRAAPDGLAFSGVKVISNGTLNEDWGGDELYVGLRVLDPSGKVVRTGASNHYYGNF